MPVDLIIFAAIAVFVLLRLYGVLGQHMGHDDPGGASKDTRDASFDKGNNVIELTPQQIEHRDIRNRYEKIDEADEKDDDLPDDMKASLAKIRKYDPGFRLPTFIEGAQTAFEMVLEAFRTGDKETLRHLLSKDIYTAFLDEIKKRKSADEFVETTLISIVSAEPKEVDVDGKQAEITLHFVSEQIEVTRTSDGETVKDSTSAIEHVEDEWVFIRDLSSANPNWKIVAI